MRQLAGSAGTKRLLARAERAYAERRAAHLGALARYEIAAYGSTGLGIWIPLAEEAAAFAARMPSASCRPSPT